MKTVALFAVILISCLTIDNASALKCYSCAGSPQKFNLLALMDPKVEIPVCKPVETECLPGNDACITAVGISQGIRVEGKSCIISDSSLEEKCKEAAKEAGQHCRICKTDLCNSAMQYKMATGVAIVLAFLVMKFN